MEHANKYNKKKCLIGCSLGSQCQAVLYQTKLRTGNMKPQPIPGSFILLSIRGSVFITLGLWLLRLLLYCILIWKVSLQLGCEVLKETPLCMIVT